MPQSIDQLQVPKEQYLLGKTAGRSWAQSAAASPEVAAAADLAEYVRAHPYHEDWLSVGAQLLKVERSQLEQIRHFWHQIAGTGEPTNPFVAGFLSGAQEGRVQQPA